MATRDNVAVVEWEYKGQRYGIRPGRARERRQSQMGAIALFGGNGCAPVGENEGVTRRLLEYSRAAEVLVVPTADAFERPDQVVATATAWFATFGVGVRPLMALTRRDAMNPDLAAVATSASFVYLLGDSPLHLRSAMKDTPVWRAIAEVAARGVVAAAGASAAAVCDPMTDPRGGAFGLGLGLVRQLAILHEAEDWSFERLHRARQLARGFCVATLPTGTALVQTDGVWARYGEGIEIVGDLPG